MKHLIKYLFPVIFLLSINTKARATGDSIHILRPIDTIFIQKDEVIGSFFYHLVVPKQTLYSLTRFYKINSEQLAEINPPLKIRLLQIGELLRIPISNKIIKTSELPKNRNSYSPVYYKVTAGEGLYGIARNYFNLKIEDIVRLNNLTDQNIYTNQLLLLGWVPLGAFTDKKEALSIRDANEKAVAKAEIAEAKADGTDSNKDKYVASSAKFSKKSAQGVGFWHKELKNTKGLYVLHRTAVPGSVISITNPMFNNTVYAKVVGTIPYKSYPDDIMIIVSPEVAAQLGVKDSRFFSRITFYTK
ncbi:MAG TPA: LysM peptidoglycan-binding domain-containing protein [Saprospiraceae bacterium]|nr:LysM peptidoglycan-binding domain-containing protein [Saprospiraceae bacterium]HQW54779.1 LysM peptidoglycan-binding domain-containing protein [Saprospiraceae bacterium]